MKTAIEVVTVVLITVVVLILLFGVTQVGARQVASSSTSVVGDHPPTRPDLFPLESVVVTGCVGSDYVMAWVVMEKLTEDPPNSPFEVRANIDGVPIPQGPETEITYEGVCYRGRGFGGDGKKIAVYKAPCDNPQEVTRVR